MNKRLLKRHKRQVSRARGRVKLSEPDLRTPEQIKAAREASRPAGGWHTGPQTHSSAPSAPSHAASPATSPPKADA